MNKQEAIQQAIDRIKGQDINPGTIIGSRLDELSYELARYEGDEAVCFIKPEEEKRFPRSEIFDIRKCINVANHLLNVGFWEEGMESTIVNVG